MNIQFSGLVKPSQQGQAKPHFEGKPTLKPLPIEMQDSFQRATQTNPRSVHFSASCCG